MNPESQKGTRSRILLHPVRIAALLFAASIALFLAMHSASGQVAQPVFALRGRLEPASDQAFATLFVAADGQRSTIVGSTPALEAILVDLAARGAAVRVWGSRQQQSPVASLPLIVATSVVEDLDATATPPPAPTSSTATAADATPSSAPITGTAAGPATDGPPSATVTAYALYVRGGPASNYAPVGTVTRGTVCTIESRTPDGGWLQLLCPTLGGWVRKGFVTVEGALDDVPFITGSTPTPLASPTPAGSWRVLGYANPNLSGPPVVSLEAPQVDFDWGDGSPHDTLPVDNFSLRLDRTLRFAPGMHQIALTYDDGARLSLDGQMVINDWKDGAERTSVWQGMLGGDVLVRIEYFDAFGPARLKFETLPLQVTLPTSTPMPPVVVPPAPSGVWQAVYFNNPDLAQPVAFAREEPMGDVYPLNHEFSIESPVEEVISADNWSARWRGRFPFEAGDYRFLARGNEGVRLYVDGVKVIDAWPNSADTVKNTFRSIGAGEHEITVELYDGGGESWVRAWWELIAAATPELTPELTPAASLLPTSTPSATPTLDP